MAKLTKGKINEAIKTIATPLLKKGISGLTVEIAGHTIGSLKLYQTPGRIGPAWLARYTIDGLGCWERDDLVNWLYRCSKEARA